MVGGQSNFSLGWDDSAQQKPKQQQQVSQSPWATDEEQKKPLTSVKYSGQLPGGNTTICLGDDGGSGSTQQRPKQGYVSQSPWATESDTQQAHTSVKYSGQLPGGNTTISLGDGSTGTDERFKTQNQANAQSATNRAGIAAGMATEAAGKKSNNPGAIPPGGRSNITF